jgi:hypothetical protein
VAAQRVHSFRVKAARQIVRVTKRGQGMRRATIGMAAVIGLVAVLAPVRARAATLFVFADPMTFETRRVVVDPSGPDRTYLCLLPPSQAGCQLVKRSRS